MVASWLNLLEVVQETRRKMGCWAPTLHLLKTVISSRLHASRRTVVCQRRSLLGTRSRGVGAGDGVQARDDEVQEDERDEPVKKRRFGGVTVRRT